MIWNKKIKEPKIDNCPFCGEITTSNASNNVFEKICKKCNAYMFIKNDGYNNTFKTFEEAICPLCGANKVGSAIIRSENRFDGDILLYCHNCGLTVDFVGKNQFRKYADYDNEKILNLVLNSWEKSE